MSRFIGSRRNFKSIVVQLVVTLPKEPKVVGSQKYTINVPISFSNKNSGKFYITTYYTEMMMSFLIFHTIFYRRQNVGKYCTKLYGDAAAQTSTLKVQAHAGCRMLQRNASA